MTGSASDWILRPRIYVENQRARDRAYDVTEAMVREALERASHGRIAPENLCVAMADARDEDAWSKAHVLIAGRLETARIRDMRSLRLVQCTSAGVENYLPLHWLPDGVSLCNASGVHAAKVAQFGAMACLMLHEGVPERVTAQKERAWRRDLRPTANGVRVLVYGAGALGGAVARALQPYGFRVSGVARHPGESRPGFSHICGPDELMSVLGETDILVVSCPLTTETRGSIGRAQLEALPKGARILNIGRAAVMDYDALVDLLESGHLGGAILDVFDQEPLPSSSRLWDVRNLMVFPHVSADDPTTYAAGCVEILAENMVALLEGRRLRNRVDPLLGY